MEPNPQTVMTQQSLFFLVDVTDVTSPWKSGQEESRRLQDNSRREQKEGCRVTWMQAAEGTRDSWINQNTIVTERDSVSVRPVPLPNR